MILSYHNIFSNKTILFQKRPSLFVLKYSCSETFWNILSKTSMWKYFKYTCRASLEFSKKFLPRQRVLDFQKYTRFCLQTCSSLRRNSITELLQEILQNLPSTFGKFGYFQIPSRNLVGSSFSIASQPLGCKPATLVKKEFLKVSGSAFPWDILMHLSFPQSCKIKKIVMLL